MREAGWGLICIGLFALFGAFLFVDVSRDVGYVPYASEYLPRMPREVANVHAMHIQSLVFQAGLASFLVGVICIGSATIDEAIRRNDPKAEPTFATTQPGATSEEIAAAATYAESAEPEPEVPAGGWATVTIVTIAIIALIIVFVANSGGTTPSSIVAENAVSNLELVNDLDAENMALEDLNIAD